MKCPKCNHYVTITKGAPYTSWNPRTKSDETYQIIYYDCSNSKCNYSKEEKKKLT